MALSNNAGLYSGASPSQYVASLYAPLRQQLSQQAQAQLAAFQNLISSALNRNGQDLQAAGQPYAAAITDTNDLARASADRLLASNPNDQTINMLKAIGAPQAQQDAVTNQNRTVFGGGAGLLGYTGGVLPSNQFAADAMARGTYLSSLPSIIASIGSRGASSLASKAQQGMLSLDQQQNADTLKATADNASFQSNAQKTAFDQAYKRASLALNEQKTGFSQKATAARLNLDAQKFAQSTLTENRNYRVALASLGIRQAAAQRAAVALDYKLANGGFTPAQVARYQGTALTIAQNGLSGFTDSKGVVHPPLGYVDAFKEMRKEGIPVSVAVKSLNEVYPAGVHPQGVSDFNIVPSAQQRADFQQTTGTGAPQSYALAKLPQYGWNNAEQAQALDALWTRESGWNPNAVNKKSGAYGIPQALGHGNVFKLGDYKAQIDWGLNYIRGRYGSPAAALAHENQFGWY